MFTKYALVQSVEPNGRVQVHFAQAEYLNWTFEYRRGRTLSDNTTIFPFCISTPVSIKTRPPGAETRCYRGSDEVIHFSDDYGVLEGFVICVLGPEGYVPSLVKFREKTSIPIYQNGFSDGSPGFVQIHSNRISRQTAIIMMTTRNCLFGTTIEFSPRMDEFPADYQIGNANTFEASIELHRDKASFLTQQDIQNYCTGIPSGRQDELLEVLNDLVRTMKESPKKRGLDSISLNKVSSTVTDLVSIGSGIVTIGDSISNHGFAYSFLRMIFGYFGANI